MSKTTLGFNTAMKDSPETGNITCTYCKERMENIIYSLYSEEVKQRDLRQVWDNCKQTFGASINCYNYKATYTKKCGLWKSIHDPQMNGHIF